MYMRSHSQTPSGHRIGGMLLSLIVVVNFQLASPEVYGQGGTGKKQEDGNTESVVPKSWMKSDQIAQSLKYSTMGNHEKAMQVLEDLLLSFPDDLEVKVHLLRRVKGCANHFVISGRRDEGYQLYKRAADLVRDIFPDVPENAKQEFQVSNCATLYNEACTFAIEGEKEKCMDSLRQAVEWGFRNLNHLMNDNDLVLVTEGREIEELLGEHLVTYKAKLREIAETSLARFEAVEFDMELPNLNQQIVKLSDFRGQPVMVTFWSTGNNLSRQNLKTMSRLQKNFGDRGVKLIAIGCERTRIAEKAYEKNKEFFAENPASYICLVAHPKIRTVMQNSHGFPSTLVINSDGKLKAVLPGELQYYSAAMLMEVMLEGRDKTPGDVTQDDSSQPDESQSDEPKGDGSSGDGSSGDDKDGDK